jgi:flagellin
MNQVINTNLMSLNAQKNLYKSGSSLQTAMERLSSGLRINHSKDDAAGFAISQRMTAQIRGMNQAMRNANDAVSLSQTAEGGLSEISNILQRMRELAVESANGTLSDDDRQSIQGEVTQLYDEIDRISDSTEFNGLKLFSGSDANSAKAFQVGANASQTISFTVGEFSTKTLSLNSTVPKGQLFSGRIDAATAADGELVINGVEVDFTSGADAATYEEEINAMAPETGVTVEAYNRYEGVRAGVDSSHVVSDITVNGVTIDDASSLTQLIDNINRQVADVHASIGKDNNIVLTNTNGDDIVIADGGNTEALAYSGLKAGTYQGYLAFTSLDGSDIEISVSEGTDPSELNKFGLNASSGNGTVISDGAIASAVANDTDPGVATANAIAQLNTDIGTYDPEGLSTDRVYINGELVSKPASGSASDMAAAINAISDETGVTATGKTVAALELDFTVTLGDMYINGATVDISAETDLAGVVDAINSAGIGGIIAEADSETGRLVLRSDAGVDIAVGNDTAAFVTEVFDDPDAADTTGLTLGASDVGAVRGRITLTSTNGGAISIAGDGSDSDGTGLDKFGLVAQNSDDIVVGGELNVLTVASSNAAIEAIDEALDMVTSKQIELGSIQNRLSSTISNLQTGTENLTASRSRIQDADFASETAALTRAQILQQAGTAMLAQANQLPQNVLSLLRG